MHVLHVVGARPNFMKTAPVMRALADRGIWQTLVHTGQHYDPNMSDVFFRELGIPAPDVNLQVNGGSHAQQTAAIMIRFEPVAIERRPDLVMVYGDVNSTIAAALVCAKLGIRIAHVEAGLRSFDRTMPEEINRILTDQISDVLFTPSPDASEHLKREGIKEDKIYLVGNVMIDTLVRMLPKAEAIPIDVPERYVLVTMHRPGNVDDKTFMLGMLDALSDVAETMPVLFPVHPRTRQRLSDFGVSIHDNGIRWMEPLSYLGFLKLQMRAAAVITDSGGIQEETTFLGIPCITMRDNTERPVTVTLGTNRLLGRNVNVLRRELQGIADGKRAHASIPPLWDGRAAERIADIVASDSMFKQEPVQHAAAHQR
jgi:UDP-N-acetylglucosamine 2-epimerase (non-hydrolysing)